MAQHDEPYGRSRRGSLAGRLLMSVALAATGIGLSPAAAHADTWRTATGSAWGQTQSSASAAAQASARNALASLATQLGEVCTNVTSSATLVYVVPSGGGYQFNGTATGLCAPAPPPPSYTVPRTATARGEGSTPGTAQQNGAAGARAAILAAGGDCTGYQTTGVTNVYTTPTGSWYIYDVTVSALCVH